MLRCPRCKTGQSLRLDAISEDSKEIREGTLICVRCGERFPVRNGIVDLLYNPPAFVVREAKGLARFSERMRHDGWNEQRIRALPNLPDGYWYVQSVSFQQLFDRIA